MRFISDWIFEDPTPAQRVLNRCSTDGFGVACKDMEAEGLVLGAFLENHPGADVTPVRAVYRNSTPNAYNFTLKGEGRTFAPDSQFVRIRGNPTRFPLEIIYQDHIGHLENLNESSYVGLDFSPEPNTEVEPFGLTITAPRHDRCACCP